MLPNPAVREVNLGDYLKIIQKRLGIILAFLVTIPTAVIILDYTTQPVYRSTASILIEKSTPKITRFEDVYQNQVPYGELQYYYQTQFKILESRDLVERVFNELRLGIDPDFRETKDPIAILRARIKIEMVKNSQIILINVEDTDALRASSIANALAKVYIRQDIEIKNRAAKEATGWLEVQLTDIKKKLQQSEEALNAYMQKNKIVTVPDIENKTQSLLEGLKEKKSTLSTSIAEASKRYKDKHPKMIALRAEMEDTEAKIEFETNTLLSLNQTMVQYNMLKKDVDSNQVLYTSMLSRAKETDISEKTVASSIRVVDTAKPAESPFKPKKGRDIILSVIIALACGASMAYFLEYLDSTIRTSEDVSTYVNLPFLGYIPTVDHSSKTEIEKSQICFLKPKDKITEAFRAIRTSMLFASPEDKPLKTILITASTPQEGKSFVSSNMAEVFCQVNERVVLLDLDMRRPKLHKNFNVQQVPGLSDFLTGNSNMAGIIKPSGIPNLSIIPSGTIPPNPSELISSKKIHILFEELNSRFDRIIVDSPPVLSAADAALLANMVDGVIFVIKGARVRLDEVLQAKDKIMQAKGKIIGVVINDVLPEKEDRYYYYHYYSEESKKNK